LAFIEEVIVPRSDNITEKDEKLRDQSTGNQKIHSTCATFPVDCVNMPATTGERWTDIVSTRVEDQVLQLAAEVGRTDLDRENTRASTINALYGRFNKSLIPNITSRNCGNEGDI
ncbi:unnamed protein product, partial [Protopolystoma xenopodis]